MPDTEVIVEGNVRGSSIDWLAKDITLEGSGAHVKADYLGGSVRGYAGPGSPLVLPGIGPTEAFEETPKALVDAESAGVVDDDGDRIDCGGACDLPGVGGSFGGRGSYPVQPTTLPGSCRYSEAREVYGSIVDPFEFGSAGGWGFRAGRLVGPPGAGGGRVRMVAMDRMRIHTSAKVSADGQVGSVRSGQSTIAYGGSGSGGSISLHARVFYSDGLITADGGCTIYSGCGAGGRIAIVSGRSLDRL